MELIQPAEISGKIMTLVDSAEKAIVIVSPYNKLWNKFNNRIEKAKAKGVNIEWYIRKDVDGNCQEVERLGIRPIEIENLHCKIYLNDSKAIITSMNLHYYSDTNSIDIGYITTTEVEYNEIVAFVNNHIRLHKPSVKEKSTITSSPDSNFQSMLFDFLTSHSSLKGVSVFSKAGKYGEVVFINAFKEHYILIFEPRTNYLRVDLRIGFDHKTRKKVLLDLMSKNEILVEKIGKTIEFGTQMNRLKIDLKFNFLCSELPQRTDFFLENKALFSRIINTYNEILE
jgi:hypothetical protein